VCGVIARCVLFVLSRRVPIDVASAFLFIASKGRARVTFMVKKVDLEKDERER
jgi:hypothetical protein